MWEYEIKQKRGGQVRKIYGETVGNAFRKFGLERESWILIQKQEIENPEEEPRGGHTKR